MADTSSVGFMIDFVTFVGTFVQHGMFVTPQMWSSPANWPVCLSILGTEVSPGDLELGIPGSQQQWGCHLVMGEQPSPSNKCSCCPVLPMGTVRCSSIHLPSPLLSLCRSLYFVLTSLYPLCDFLLAQGYPHGSQRARALSVVEEIILFLVSWTFKSV